MKNPRPSFLTIFRTKNKKVRIVNYVLITFLVLYAMMVIFPGFLFGHSIKYKTFNIQSTQPIDDSLFPILDNTKNKLALSEIYDSTLMHDIFLCNSFSLYTLLAPLSRRAFACNYPLFNNIFLAQTDLQKNEAYKNDQSDSYSRDISALIAHEVTHTFIEKRIGFWKFRKLSTWKNEGYCEYVGLGKENNIDTDKQLVATHPENQKPGEKYRKYYLAVNYLIGLEKMTFDELIVTEKQLDDIILQRAKSK